MELAVFINHFKIRFLLNQTRKKIEIKVQAMKTKIY
jgi:hypothetical protein